MHQVFLGTRALLYLEGRADSGFAQVRTLTGIGLVVGLLLGGFVTRVYDRRGCHRIPAGTTPGGAWAANSKQPNVIGSGLKRHIIVTRVGGVTSVVNVLLVASTFVPKGRPVPSFAAGLRRAAASCAVLMLCTALATSTGQPVARAEARALLASAIANTKGSYLVYNFGSGHPAPMLDAGGNWYDGNSGGHLMVIKAAAQRLSPHLLVDTHQGFQARCERNPGARTGDGLWQASETYAPLQAWQVMGRPTIAVNANFFDIRGQKGGSWRSTGCSSPMGAYVDNTHGLGRANQAVTGTIAYAGKPGLSGGDEHWTPLATMILPTSAAPYVVAPRGGKNGTDYEVAAPVIQGLVDKGAGFVAVSGLGLLSPGNTGQLGDGGPIAARTALAYARPKDELYVFQGGSYTPDNIQDLFRGLGSDSAVLLDGGGSSAIVLRRDTGGMWAGAGVPKGNCDTRQVLCDSHERALPSWLAFN